MAAMNAQQAALRTRLHNLVLRGVLTRIRNGGGALVAQAAGRADELRDDVVLVYPFGFAAWPVASAGDKGPEAVVIQFEGNARAALPPMDRRHWSKSGVTTADEASLYTTKARVLVKANGDIEITSPGKLTVTAPGGMVFDTPLAEFTGDVVDSTALGNALSIRGSRDVYEDHDHPGDSGGTTGKPNQSME